MARIRSIHPSACGDEDVATMSPLTRIAWAYLPCHADREGRLKDSPFMLKVALLPADNADMDAILNELAERRHIVRYQTAAGRFIQIRNFKKYQNPHKNEVPSSIAPPIENNLDSLEKLPERDGVTLEKDRIAPAVRSGSSPSPIQSTPSIPRNGTRIWNANAWLEAFKAAFFESRAKFYGHGESDAKATAKLGDLLAEMPEADLLEAQARAKAMFAEYFADRSKAVVDARWCFYFFVTRWNGLRIPAEAPKDADPNYPRLVPLPEPESEGPRRGDPKAAQWAREQLAKQATIEPPGAA